MCTQICCLYCFFPLWCMCKGYVFGHVTLALVYTSQTYSLAHNIVCVCVCVCAYVRLNLQHWPLVKYLRENGVYCLLIYCTCICHQICLVHVDLLSCTKRAGPTILLVWLHVPWISWVLLKHYGKKTYGVHVQAVALFTFAKMISKTGKTNLSMMVVHWC